MRCGREQGTRGMGVTLHREVSKSYQRKHHLNWDLKDKMDQFRYRQEHSKQWKQQVQMPWGREGFKDWQKASAVRQSEQGRWWQQMEVGKPGRSHYREPFKAKVDVYILFQVHVKAVTLRSDMIQFTVLLKHYDSALYKINFWWGILSCFGCHETFCQSNNGYESLLGIIFLSTLNKIYWITKETNYTDTHFYQESQETKDSGLRGPADEHEWRSPRVRMLLQWIWRGRDDIKKTWDFWVLCLLVVPKFLSMDKTCVFLMVIKLI